MPAGYSGTPLPKKLGIKDGHRVGLLGSPEDFELEELPDDVRLVRRLEGKFDVIVCFVDRASVLERRFPKLKAALEMNGGLWIGWPKKSSGRKTDLNFDIVQGIGLHSGLVDNKICAIDEIWSGLRFVYRLKDRK